MTERAMAAQMDTSTVYAELGTASNSQQRRSPQPTRRPDTAWLSRTKNRQGHAASAGAVERVAGLADDHRVDAVRAAPAPPGYTRDPPATRPVARSASYSR